MLFTKKVVTEAKTRSSVGAWLRRNYPAGPCERCLEKRPYEIHHKDRNWRNNSPDNLERLCSSCHGAEHAGDEARASATVGWRTRKKAAVLRQELACAECDKGIPVAWRDGSWKHGDVTCSGSLNVHGGFSVAVL